MAFKKYTKKTPQEIEQELDKLLNTSLDRIKKYADDPEEMLEYAKFVSKIHNYSTTNLALIDEQFPGARAVASFQNWSKEGFRINKGEKGIEIYSFTPYTKFIDKKGNEKFLKNATPLEKEQIKSKELKSWKVDSFKKGHVYDISQTNATDKDLPKMFPNKVWNFDIKSDHDIESLEKGINAISNTIGIEIKDMQDGKFGELGSARGAFVKYVDGTDEIVLNSRNSRTQNLAVGIHELAHAKLHSRDSDPKTRPVKEFQAELTSYIVSYHYGMDTSEKAIPYIAKWTRNGEEIDPKELRTILTEVKDTAASFINEIDNEILQERELAQEQNVSVASVENDILDPTIVNVNKDVTLKNTFETGNVFKEENSKLNEEFFKKYQKEVMELDESSLEEKPTSVEAVPNNTVIMNGVTVELPFYAKNIEARTMLGVGNYYRDMIEYYQDNSSYSFEENINQSDQTEEYVIGKNKLILDHACNEIVYLDQYGVTDNPAKNNYAYEVMNGRTEEERKYIEGFLKRSTEEFELEQSNQVSQSVTISNSFSSEEFNVSIKESLYDTVIRECSYNLSDKAEIYYDKEKWISEIERQTNENVDSFEDFNTVDDPTDFYEDHKDEIEETIEYLSKEHGIDKDELINNDGQKTYEEAAGIFAYQAALKQIQNKISEFEVPDHPRLEKVDIVKQQIDRRNEFEMA